MENNIESKYYYVNVVGKSDIGRRRKANEDNGGHFECQNGYVAVVCDGMGGHVGGAVASGIAVETIKNFLTGQYFEDPREAIGLAIQAANEAILHRQGIEPELTGMGSTCVLLIVRGGKVYIGHVGDSRIYLVRDKTIVQLTKDHSFVQMLVDAGEITKEEAERHPRKNEITNALGIPDMRPATVRQDAIDPQAGDCFLLCSDGLSGMVSDKQIETIISKQREYSTQQRADFLVQAANENGGVDNITVELVEFTMSPDEKIKKQGYKKILAIGTVLTVFVVLCSVFCVYMFGGKRQVRQTLGEISYRTGEVAYVIDNDSVFSPITGDRFSLETTVDSVKTNLECTKTDASYELRFPTVRDNMDSVRIDVYAKNVIFCFSSPIRQTMEQELVVPQNFKGEAGNDIARIKILPDGLIIEFPYVKTETKYGKKKYEQTGRVDSLAVEPDGIVTVKDSVYVVKFNKKTKYKDNCVTISYTCNDTIFKHVVLIDESAFKKRGTQTDSPKTKVISFEVNIRQVGDSSVNKSDKEDVTRQIPDSSAVTDDSGTEFSDGQPQLVTEVVDSVQTDSIPAAL